MKREPDSIGDRLARWRADTIGCAHRNHLNNAGAALMPSPVVDAMVSHLALEASIGGYEAADLRGEAIDGVYRGLADLVGAHARNIAIVEGATAGFVQAVSSFDLAPGDTVVTTRCDYTSYQIQFLALSKRRGVRILYPEDLPDGGVDPDAVRQLLSRSRSRFVHVSWVPTNSGLVQDVESVGAVCEEFDVPFLIDACQAVGQLPIDVTRLRCDYLAVSARKFLRGPRSIGFLYASDRALNRGDHPLFVDMRGAEWTADDEYSISPNARRFEGWELPYASVHGLGAAVQYASAEGIPETGRRAIALASRMRDGLAAVPAVRVLDRGRNVCAIVTASVGEWPADRLVLELGRRGINTTASLASFGRFDFQEKGVTSALRLSPHYYNTESEVDAAVGAIAELAHEHPT